MDQRYDCRDTTEHETVAAILAERPPGHAAPLAYAQGADTTRITHLVADSPQLVESLKETFLAGYRRVLARSGGHFRP